VVLGLLLLEAKIVGDNYARHSLDCSLNKKKSREKGGGVCTQQQVFQNNLETPSRWAPDERVVGLGKSLKSSVVIKGYIKPLQNNTQNLNNYPQHNMGLQGRASWKV